MRQKNSNSGSGKVACDVCLMACLMEIPRDLALSDEATDYVYYFLGAADYAQGQEPALPAEERRPPDADWEASAEG